ncbi:MAG: DCC1-like thiol-disulfide oxidoreductase family protein [Pseudomonadota bacterium]
MTLRNTAGNLDEGWRHHVIVVFDAECVLCSANAKFILTHDREGRFRLASVQSDIGQSIYRRHDMDPEDPVSMIVIENGTLRTDSDGVIAIFANLGLPWSAARMAKIVPHALRDRTYRFIARNRYRLFGKRDSCWVAPPEYRARIL